MRGDSQSSLIKLIIIPKLRLTCSAGRGGRSAWFYFSFGPLRLWGQPPRWSQWLCFASFAKLSINFYFRYALTTYNQRAANNLHVPPRVPSDRSETLCSWTIEGNRDRLKRLHWFMVFVWPWEKKRGPGKPNHRVSISQGLQTTGHASISPQTVNNASSSIPPPPPHLSRSVAELTGTCPSVPL